MLPTTSTFLRFHHGTERRKGVTATEGRPQVVCYTQLCSACWPLNETSIQDALRAFLPPIKNDDARLDFYTVYKREATEYDADYVKKYDEDLNTTLIFVRRLSLTLANYLTWSCRLVCSLPSAQRSLSMSNQIFNPIRTSNQQPSSVQSFSLSIIPLSPMKPPLFYPPRKIHPMRSSPYLGSCMQAS